MEYIVKPRRVYVLLLLIGVAIILLITGYMDDDWRTVSYYFNSIQNSWDYWEYCPFIRINWWLAYVIDTVKVAVGWIMLTFSLMYVSLALLGKLKDA